MQHIMHLFIYFIIYTEQSALLCAQEKKESYIRPTIINIDCLFPVTHLQGKFRAACSFIIIKSASHVWNFVVTCPRTCLYYLHAFACCIVCLVFV